MAIETPIINGGFSGGINYEIYQWWILQPAMLEKRLVFIDLQAPGANSHPAPAASSRSVPAEGQGQTPVASLPHAASHFASVAPHSEVVARHPEPMAI